MLLLIIKGRCKCLLALPVIHEQDKFFELKLQLLKIIKLFQIGYCSYNTKRLQATFQERFNIKIGVVQ